MPMCTLALMVALKALELLFSRARTMHEAPSSNSTAMIGKAACSKFARTGLPVVAAAWASAAVEVMAAECVVDSAEVDSAEAASAAVAEVSVALADVGASAAASDPVQVPEVALAASMLPLHQQCCPTPLPTMQPQERKEARSSMFET